MNYRPNISAKRLRAADNNVFAIAVYYTMDYRAAYMIRFLGGLRQKIKEMGLHVDLIIKQYERLQDTFEEDALYHAAIVCNASEDDLVYLEGQTNSIPIVLYNRKSERFSSVCLDHGELGRSAIEILHQKGANHVLFISNRIIYRGMEDITKEFYRLADVYGMKVSQVETEDNMQSAACAVNNFLKDNDMPDACFAASSYTSYAIINMLLRRGYRIPEQIRFLGTGSGFVEYEDYGFVSSSTLEIPREEMAGKCLEVALQLVRQEIEQPVTFLFEPTYVERESC